jgi:hypothetical protein
MNRFEFAVAALSDGETVVVKHESVKIYDGHEKVIIFSRLNLTKMKFHEFLFRPCSKTVNWCSRHIAHSGEKLESFLEDLASSNSITNM